MRDTNITMTRGDTLSFGIEYEGTDQDLDTAIFAISFSGGFLIQKTLGNGISKVGPGQYVVRIAPEDTENTTGTFRYDFQVGINDDRFTLLQGNLTIERDVARL